MLLKMLSPTIILQVVSFLDMFAMGLIVPQLGNHMRQMGFNHIEIGFMGALYSACQMISAPIIGSLSDIKGSKSILLLCCVICGGSYFWLGFTASFFVFYLLRATLGLFKQTQQLTKTVVTDYENDKLKQGVLYGRLMSLGGLGMASGPVISGHIVEAYPNYGFTTITTVILGIFMINTGLTSLLPYKAKQKKQSKEVLTPNLLNSIIGSLKESVNEFNKVDWPIYWDIFLYKLLITLTMGLYYSNFSLFLKVNHGVTPKSLGYIIAMQGIIGAISNYYIGHINKLYKHDHDYTQRVFHVFLIITLSLLGLVIVPNVYLFSLVLIPKTIFGNLARVISLEMLTNRSNSGHKGAVIGASNSVKSLSGVITPVVSGFVTEYLGLTYAICVGASFAAAGTVASYLLGSKARKEKTK